MDQPRHQHYLSHFKEKLLDSEDLLNIALLLFTIFCFFQEKSIHVWLPMCTSILACVVYRGVRLTIRDANLRIVANHRTFVLLAHLLIYYWAFVWLQKLRTTTSTRLKEKEEILVLIYIAIWYTIGVSLECFGHKLWLTVITILTWISTTIGLVLTILCFEEILNEDSALLCKRLYAAWIIGIKYGFTFISVIFTGLFVYRLNVVLRIA